MKGVVDVFLSEKYSLYRNIAGIFGVAFLGRIALRTLRDLCSGFRAYFLAPLGLRINLLKYGKWAVVTGASDGIGKEYAIELARRGLNIVLMSRSKDKLDKVADEIKKLGRDTIVIPVDFSGGMDIYSMIKDQLETLDIGILVNNVGIYYEYPDLLCNIPAEVQYKIVQVNCQPVVQMTHLILPGMISRGKGIVVNISSVSGMLPSAKAVIYCATKVFVDYFSEGLRKEYHSKGIMVQNVAPGMVSTNLSHNPPTNSAIMAAPAYAKAAVATIGIQDYTHGCFSHAVQCYIFRMLPTFVLNALVRLVSSQLRQHILKQEKKAKKE